MMSQQINFYLTERDQAELEVALRTVGSFVPIADIDERGGPCVLESATIREMGKDRLKIHLVEQGNLSEVRFQEVPAREFRVVDVIRSPVVEFVRCYYVGGQLRRGRLYVATAFYEGSSLIRKHKSFVEWASSLIAGARNALIKDRKSFFYFGKEALQLREDGIELLS
jgi:hypothetical protein